MCFFILIYFGLLRPVRDASEPKVVGDIAVDDEHDERNADPCTSSGCMWPKSTDGKVYVPYVIANHFQYVNHM